MDRYRLLHVIGEGANGRVHMAEDRELGRRVALKFLSAERSRDERARERFRREALAAAALDHPFICKVYEVGRWEETSYIAMELVEGRTLEERLAGGRPPVPEALAIATEVAEAMDRAHRGGVLHRDLKPSNVMLTPDGHVKLLDFGLARFLAGEGGADALPAGHLTHPGTPVGTPYYMSPEQLRGERVDERSDLFGFGILLYEMLSGRHPFRRPSVPETLAAILNDPPPPLAHDDVPTHVSALARRLLHKDAEQRPGSFADVRASLTTGRIPAAPPGVSRPPLAGREREMTDLAERLERAEGGAGGLVLIGGEPGVGKTRLAEEALSVARERGTPAFAGRCSESGRLPLLPFVDILEAAVRAFPPEPFRALLGDSAPEIARLVPQLRSTYADLPEPLALPPEARRRFLFNSLEAFLGRLAAERGLVLLVDDAQWADESTLGLLAHVAPRLGSAPVLLLATYRDTEVDGGHSFFEWLESLVRRRLARRLALRPLSERSVGQMLERLGRSRPPERLVRAIHSRTDGNPFFVEEVFQQLQESGSLFEEDGGWTAEADVDSLNVPEGVRLVIEHRLRRLEPGTVGLLRMAAIVGRSFELDVLKSLSGLPEGPFLDGLEEAEHARLIAPSRARPEAEYLFAHDLIRHTLAEAYSPRRRQALHLAVAHSIERVVARPDERVEALAHHYDQAGAKADRGKRLQYLMAAGEKALNTAAADEAVRLLTRGLELCPEDGATRARLLFHRGLALRVVVRWEESYEDWREALPLFERLGAGDEVAEICDNLWFFFGWTGQWPRALEVAERGLAVLGDTRSGARSRLLTYAALASDVCRGHQKAEKLRALALEIAEDLGDEFSLGRHHFHVATRCFLFPDPKPLVSHADAGAELLRRAKQPWDWCPALVWAQVGRVCLGRIGEIEELSARALPEARRIGHMGAVVWAQQNEAQVLLMRTGDLGRFEALERENAELCSQIGLSYAFVMLGSLGVSLVYQGRWMEALEVLRKGAAEEDAAGGSTVGRGGATSALVWALAHASPEAARPALERWGLSPFLAARQEPYYLGEWQAVLRLTEALALLGDDEAAAGFHPDLCRGLERGLVVTVWCEGLLERVAGIAAACARDWDAAQEHFEAALEQAHRLPHRVDQPETRRWYARMLRKRGGKDSALRARALEEEAAVLYRQLGMRKHAELLGS